MTVVRFTNALALDVGEKRIGIARASAIARLAEPLSTLLVDGSEHEGLQKLINAEHIDLLVIGLPRGMEGQETAQTQSVRAYAKQLEALGVQMTFQDESLTSIKAEEALRRKGDYQKADVDSMAAALILEDFLTQA